MTAKELRQILLHLPTKSDFAPSANTREDQGISPSGLAPNGASESARQDASRPGSNRQRESEAPAGVGSAPSSPLGPPMTITEAARLLGCSPWTVRQKYLPQGLPHLRTSAAGRLVFFQQQVITWILRRQELQKKGGLRK